MPPQIQWLIDHLIQEAAVIRQAPLLFILLTAAMFVLAYLIVRWGYRELLEIREKTITALRESPATFQSKEDKWFTDLAEKDKLEIQHAVYVTECKVYETLTGDEPEVTFDFFIRNCAVYAITLDSTLTGFISLNGTRRLKGNLRASAMPHNLQHCFGDRFRLRQELDAGDIKAIEELDAAMPRQGFYDFSNLNITIKGSTSIADVVPARLQFKRVTRRGTTFDLV